MKAIQDWRWAGDDDHRYQQSYIVRVSEDQLDDELARCRDRAQEVGGLPVPNIVEVDELPPEPVQPNAAILAQAFWEAGRRLRDDESVHDMEKPYFDEDMSMVDASGAGFPSAFFGHMADALTELRAAAGLGG